MPFARSTTTVLAIVGLAAGCGPYGGTTRRSSDATSDVSPQTVLTAQELARGTPQGSLMDALKRQRPSFLVSRGGDPPMVSVNGAPPAELSILQTISVSDVCLVQQSRSVSNGSRPAITSSGRVVLGDVIAVTICQGGREER